MIIHPASIMVYSHVTGTRQLTETIDIDLMFSRNDEIRVCQMFAQLCPSQMLSLSSFIFDPYIYIPYEQTNTCLILFLCPLDVLAFSNVRSDEIVNMYARIMALAIVL
jgi:hypothetical protein